MTPDAIDIRIAAPPGARAGEGDDPRPPEDRPKVMRAPRKRARSALFSIGEPLIWLTGGSLVVCAAMIVGLVALILIFGLSTFWPSVVVELTTFDGQVFMGELTRTQTFQVGEEVLESLPAGEAARLRAALRSGDGKAGRTLVRTGNFKLTQNHFQWVDDCRVKERREPEWAVVLERMEWGRFYGFPEAFALVTRIIDPKDGSGGFKSLDQKRGEARRLMEELSPRFGGAFQVLGEITAGEGRQQILIPADRLEDAVAIQAVAEVAEGPVAAWSRYEAFHGEVRDRLRERRKLERVDTGDINDGLEEARLAVRTLELDIKNLEVSRGSAAAEENGLKERYQAARERYREVQDRAGEAFSRIRGRIDEINAQNGRYLLAMRTAGEGEKPPLRTLIALDEIVRAYPANQLGLFERFKVYLSRWWEYLSDEPREANSEGGVFPAIFGTVVMTLMMALAVVPFGVFAALYLREYAKAGPVVSAVRIAVNNLAGVPSIVFGVFGLGFFCYGVGSFIDGGPSWQMPKPIWFILLGSVSVAGICAFLAFLGGIAKPGRPAAPRQALYRHLALVLWILCALGFIVLVATTPFFEGFYRARLPNPTFGKGTLIWASLTLALLTLPVVIVATEEALAAVPNSMREGSYACGASKWQTIRRIVLPRALPGIMTGMILAMARGAGEVAPLMLVGAVKFTPKLPFDGSVPFGLDRSFMHLGFHIYDVGFQSQNSEAAIPMVYTTTLLLILIVAALNISAIWLRTRLGKRFVESQF